jgi:hypothetical protein
VLISRANQQSPGMSFEKMTDEATQRKIDEATQSKKAKLESLGYRTAHLSVSEINDLMSRVERERPATDWRSKL